MSEDPHYHKLPASPPPAPPSDEPGPPTLTQRLLQILLFVIGGVGLAIVVNLITSEPPPQLVIVKHYPWYFLGGTLALIGLLTWLLERSHRQPRRSTGRQVPIAPAPVDRADLMTLVRNLLAQSEPDVEHALTLELGLQHLPQLVPSARHLHCRVGRRGGRAACPRMREGSLDCAWTFAWSTEG